MRRGIERTTLLLMLALVVVRSAHGQSAGADETSVDAAVAQNIANAPAAGSWQWSGSAGFQFQSGRSEQFGVNVDIIVAHATRHLALARLDLELNRSEYSPEPGAKRVVSDDTRTAALTLLPRWKPHFTIAAIGSWHQDRPAKLDYRTMAQVGPYVEPVANKKITLAFAPLIGAGVQDNMQSDSEQIVAFGALQSLVWRPTTSTTIEVFGSQHRNAQDADDYMVLVNTSVTSQLSKYFSLYVSHQYSIESIHPVGVDQDKQTVNFGFRIAGS